MQDFFDWTDSIEIWGDWFDESIPKNKTFSQLAVIHGDGTEIELLVSTISLGFELSLSSLWSIGMKSLLKKDAS